MTLDKQRRRIDIVRDDDFVSDLENVSMTELRERRVLCDELDTELSYYRRLLHGRMDLLAFELRRRAGEEDRTLIEALPEILAGAEELSEPRPGIARTLPITTPDIPSEGRRVIDRVLGDDFLTRLSSMTTAELEEIQRLLTDVEHDISEQRRAVYDAHERVHAELTRRYREGLADAGELLDHT